MKRQDISFLLGVIAILVGPYFLLPSIAYALYLVGIGTLFVWLS